jgi:hypothetical protein
MTPERVSRREAVGIGTNAMQAGFDLIRCWSEHGVGANLAVQDKSSYRPDNHTDPMKLQLATYVCAKCGAQFPSAEIVGGYGTLLFRSEALVAPP